MRGFRGRGLMMRNLMSATLFVALPLIVAFTNCNGDGISGPPPGLPFATATRSCGPADGPAVSIYLSRNPESVTPTPPFVILHINEPLEQLAGRSWTVGGQSTAIATHVMD